MKTISPNELSQRLTSDPGSVVIDVRTPVEYAEVHVPQAKLEPLDKLDPTGLAISGTAAKDKPVYILCRSGQRATKAAEKLAAEGFQQPIVVEGGTLAWIEEGLPVNRGQVKVISLERQVRIVAGSLVLVGVLLGWFVHPAFVWISGFVGAGLVFAGITDFCGMGLLLAKAPWNQRAPSSSSPQSAS
ncbi:rhodanese-like domain-containing protein [Roseimicrobium sp. ORNL1]|uniref:rhodanese-like domain-containing protein n=1 Tax=Roseimicrobium sp. ORNL1 TaxID=2711231 RepID=UPI0013E202F9|nr:rhodanese-like domain-containing protein [Roseimicrobium sp. ORNL1]QIF03997.1 rhodanese-like domain-containing protein [Roseimicrobium sp. ORNL1]